MNPALESLFDRSGWTPEQKAEHEQQVSRVKAMSSELKKILQGLADEFGTTPEEMAKLIQRRLERRKRENKGHP